MLQAQGIHLEIGNPKNVNKNPVAERAIEELGRECVSLYGGPVSKATLALSTANFNSRICRDGISARELWTRCDQITGDQLNFTNRDIIHS